jgi:hypothetical protein
MKKAQSAEELKLKASFESAVGRFRDAKYEDRMHYPLAFWTLANDRRLPLSLLDYSLKKVLQCTFEELAATPGIGTKKLRSLVLLLERAAQDTPPAVPISVDPQPEKAPVVERFRPVDAAGGFDPSLVSEALWQQWQETVVLHELENEKLGRLAPSLRELPTVIWETPLSHYTSQSLQQIRQLRTHGEKRVRVVLEVFFVIHEMLHQTGRHPRLQVRLSPTFIAPLERWFADVLNRESLPSRDEICHDLVAPLIDQLDLDVGADVVRLVRGRLGIDGPMVSVRQQSRDLGVTRARVYQLLDECQHVMSVRWPEGRRLFADLLARLEKECQEPEIVEYFTLVHEQFFPRKYAEVELMLEEAR